MLDVLLPSDDPRTSWFLQAVDPDPKLMLSAPLLKRKSKGKCKAKTMMSREEKPVKLKKKWACYMCRIGQTTAGLTSTRKISLVLVSWPLHLL